RAGGRADGARAAPAAPVRYRDGDPGDRPAPRAEAGGDRGSGEDPEDRRGDRRRAHPAPAGEVPGAGGGRGAPDPRDPRAGAAPGKGRSTPRGARHTRRALAPRFLPLPPPGGSPILRGHGQQEEGGKGLRGGSRPEAARKGESREHGRPEEGGREAGRESAGRAAGRRQAGGEALG